MIVYHGTRVNRHTILREGLKRPDYNKLIDETLARYGYTRKNVPEWIWENELDYRKWEYQQFSPEFQPHIAFSLSYDQAKNYAFMGGEFEYLLIYHLFLWKTSDSEGLTSLEKAEEARKEAVKHRGTMKVITVKLPDSLIPLKIRTLIQKIESLGYDRYDQHWTWNIPIFQDVPPDWIKKIDQIEKKEHLT